MDVLSARIQVSRVVDSGSVLEIENHFTGQRLKEDVLASLLSEGYGMTEGEGDWADEGAGMGASR